ncbi:uncharacterized protein [Miscanthus floridulus]|uniref:uncharacterized protein n=1 Tax=Miscanthus floridulus TaxID=154761 RepID=UPI003457746D
MRSRKERLSKGVFSHAETVGALVSYQRRDALEELEEASDPHKEELNAVDAPKQDQDEDIVIIEDEKLMEETSAEEPSVTNQECTDKSEMQEHQLDDEECHAPLATPEVSEDDEGANFHDDGGSSSGLLDKGVCEETYDVGEEMGLVLGVPALQPH